MICDFAAFNKGSECRSCGYTLPRDFPGGLRRKCCHKNLGLGDMVAKVTTAIGIPPCGGCKKRQEWLNKIGRPITG